MDTLVLAELPSSVDLSPSSGRDVQHWLPGRQFDSSHWVLVDGHPYAASQTHEASHYNRPGSGQVWETYWTRALLPTTRYRVGSALLGFQEFVTDDSVPPIVRSIATSQIKTVSATSYTILQSDFGKILDFTAGTAVTVTVPEDLGVDFVVGISQGGVGQVTLAGSGGVAITEPDSQLSTAARYVLLTLMAFGQDTFRLYGRTA